MCMDSLARASVGNSRFALGPASRVEVTVGGGSSSGASPADLLPGGYGLHLGGCSFEGFAVFDRVVPDSILLSVLRIRAGCPVIDLFAFRAAHQLPWFLSRTLWTPSRGPVAFSGVWNWWEFI